MFQNICVIDTQRLGGLLMDQHVLILLGFSFKETKGRVITQHSWAHSNTKLKHIQVWQIIRPSIIRLN